MPEVYDALIDSQTYWYICEEFFETDKPVIDYDPFTHEFRGLENNQEF